MRDIGAFRVYLWNGFFICQDLKYPDLLGGSGACAGLFHHCNAYSGALIVYLKVHPVRQDDSNTATAKTQRNLSILSIGNKVVPCLRFGIF
jgi:hypothetical protein